MVVPIIGSMAIRGVFQSGGLLSGLGKTSGKLKEVQQRSKSTTTEMKRMTSGANEVKKALALIGVAGFSALLMTTPQLAGALAKIKHEMQRIAWSIGKHLKPVLDAVATILRGIRTGDWSVIIQGVKDLVSEVGKLVAKAGKYVIDLVLEVPFFAGLWEDFTGWIDRMKTAWEEGDLLGLISGMMEPAKWLQGIFDSIGEFLFNMGKNAIEKFIEGFKSSPTTALYDTIMALLPAGTKPMVEFGGRVVDRELGKGQTGLHVPRTGMYNLHAGETVTMRGSTPNGGGANEIIIDFSGANINLASGIQLDQFAEVLSNKIAERQSSLTY